MLYLDSVEEKLPKELAEQAAIRYTSLINDAGGQRYPEAKLRLAEKLIQMMLLLLFKVTVNSIDQKKEKLFLIMLINFEKDRISQKSKDILEGILSSNKRKNLLMGPSGVGNQLLVTENSSKAWKIYSEPVRDDTSEQVKQNREACLQR